MNKIMKQHEFLGVTSEFWDLSDGWHEVCKEAGNYRIEGFHDYIDGWHGSVG